MNNEKNTDKKFEILKNIRVLSETATGYKKSVDIVAWFDKEPTMDIRKWTNDYEKASKGVSLTKTEAIILRDVLNSIDIERTFEV